jgi:putative oxidoreductase
MTLDRPLFAHLGLLVLRLGFAGHLLLLHGLDKLENFSKRAGSFSDPLGIGHRNSLIGAIVGEVFCAALLALGLFSRVAAAGVAFTMGVVIFVHHASDPWKRKELALLYFLAAVALFLTGPGRFSLDATLIPRLRGRLPRR